MTTRALVVGGTGGIGYAIACRIAANASSTVTISGRTKPANIPHPNIQFRALDASKMRSIKQYADEYKSDDEEKLDILVLSPGILTTAGRTETPEGLDNKMALHYYGRQLLIRELMPVLKDNAKILIVLDGIRGNPNHLVWDDLDLKKNYSLGNAASHCISMNDAMIQLYAQQNAENSTARNFIHAYPGIVKTDLFESLPWYLRGPSRVVNQFIAVSPEDCAKALLTATDECAQHREGFWHCVDAQGNLAKNKPTWTPDQIKKVEEHTWKILDDVLNANNE